MTVSTGKFQEIEQSSEHIYNSVRRYLPELAKRLMMTYLVPVLAGVSIGAIVLFICTRLLPIPSSTAGLLSIAVNLLIMVNGWRWMERRTSATPLFAAYTAASRERRELQEMLTCDTEFTKMQIKLDSFESTAVDFIAQMKQQGAKPVYNQQVN